MSAKVLKAAETGISGRVVAHPGSALKALRNQRGWTLAEVSKRTGLPVSTLSKIENERISLNYDKLALLSASLGVDISELFSPASAVRGAVIGRRSFTPRGQGQFIETPNYNHIYPAADFLNKRFIPIIAELRARTLEEFGELIRHPGEEYAYVLEGTVLFHTELYAPLTMRKGDSIYFDSGMGHAYLASEPGPCRVLSICSGPESQLKEALQREAPARPTQRGRRPG
jgi:transcriptional regulator with XRE-family HTH domain